MWVESVDVLKPNALLLPLLDGFCLRFSSDDDRAIIRGSGLLMGEGTGPSSRWSERRVGEESHDQKLGQAKFSSSVSMR